jgi:NADPH-dependent glutamate synthase beta subunit-like oxidoreductase
MLMRLGAKARHAGRSEARLAALQADDRVAPVGLQAAQRRAARRVGQPRARLAHVQQAHDAVRGRDERVQAVRRERQAAHVVARHVRLRRAGASGARGVGSTGGCSWVTA